MKTICHSCRAESNFQNTHCVHRQPENYCHEHGLRKPCSSCSQIEFDKQQERYETFKAVALAKINELELDHVRHYAAGVANPEVEFLGRLSEGCFLRFSNITEAILAGAQEFSTKGKVGR